jgi:hypothetical protein
MDLDTGGPQVGLDPAVEVGAVHVCADIPQPG